MSEKLEIVSLSEIREESVKEHTIKIMKETLEIGLARELIDYFIKALEIGLRLSSFEAQAVKIKVNRVLRQMMEANLATLINLLRSYNYEIRDIDSFVDSVDRELNIRLRK